ncbi:MAG: lytic transglycosylase domain-containing protein [Micromonosporaceae bacterium]
MSRSWIRVSLRVFAVFLLVGGLVAGVYVGVTRQAADEAAKRASSASSDRALSDLDRVSRDAGRTARDHKSRADAAARARAKADAAGKEAAARVAEGDKALADKKKEESTKPSAPVGPIPASCKVYSGNKATGCALMLEWGYKLDQMPCLEKLWDKESGWNERASNPNTGAYGIPQALPGDKMASHGDDWRTNPVPQIKWGLDYIKGRYDTPCGAWTFFQNNGWY